MSQITQKIAKNASVLFGSQLIMWLLTMALTIVMPRYLGAAGVGKIHFATSLWTIIGVIAAFGIDTLLIKEIARQPARTAALFGSALVLRCLLFLIGYLGLIVTLEFFGYPTDTIIIVCLIGIANLIRQIVALTQRVEYLRHCRTPDCNGGAQSVGATLLFASALSLAAQFSPARRLRFVENRLALLAFQLFPGGLYAGGCDHPFSPGR
jgi:hypothetical protein